MIELFEIMILQKQPPCESSSFSTCTIDNIVKCSQGAPSLECRVMVMVIDYYP